MSTHLIQPPIYLLACDRDGCGQHVRAGDEWSARQTARDEGWDVGSRGHYKPVRVALDYCPGHHKGGYRGVPTPVQVALLRRATGGDVVVFATPGRAGAGIHAATYRALNRAGLIEARETGADKVLALTAPGRNVLAEIDAAGGGA